MKNSMLFFVTILSSSINCFAQKTMLPSNEETQKKYVYVDVIKTYERVAQKGYKSVEMFKKIGDSYYTNFEPGKAANWYCELFAMTTDLEPEYFYRYAQSLQAIGQNDQANEIMQKYIQKYKQNDNAKILLKNNHHEK